MKITSMAVVPMAAPYLCDMGEPYSKSEKIGGLAVLLRSDQGVVGENLLIAGSGKGLSIIAAMVRSLEPLVVGEDPLKPGAFMAKARAELKHLGPAGVSLMGLGAVEGALLDMRAKIVGLPIHRMLGAVHERLPAYYSAALWPHVGLDGLQKAAKNIVDKGYWGMKLRAGAGRLEDQVARVRAIREAVGHDVKLLIDINQRLDERRATRLGRAIEPYDIYWFEEPVDGQDHEAEARVAAALDTPVAAGESAFSLAEFKAMIELRSADTLMPDLQRVGGPMEFLRIGALAGASRIQVSGHTLPEMSLSVMACLRNADCLEVMPWSAPFYEGEIDIQKGDAIVGERQGWSQGLDVKAMRKYALEATDI
jgi:L-alanine-DL-glutamate epimerase-like enolase superfamily enzyme